MLDKTIGEQIKDVRRKLGLSQKQIAERLGTTQQSIERWENGIQPKGENLARLSEEFGIESKPQPKTHSTSRPLQDLPLYALSPDKFQLFCRDLLIEQGHKNAQVYGVSGDKQDGIDVMSNDEAQIAIQCKRVQSFGPKKVQEVIELYSSQGRNDKDKIIALTKEHTRAEQDTATAGGWIVWDLSDLSKKVRDLPEHSQRRIMRTYFPGERQLLENCLGLKSTSPFVEGDEYFRQYGDGQLLNYELQYHGDSKMVGAVLSAVNNCAKNTAVIVHGAGGMGKTRLLKEIYLRSERPVFFLQENAQIKADDLEELRDKDVVLVIDDAHRRQDELRACLSLAGTKNKILVTTRSYALSEVRKTLSQRNLVDQDEIFEVKKLDFESARELVYEIAGGTALDEQLISVARDNTLLLTLGAKALRDNRALPNRLLSMESVQEKIRELVEEYINNATPLSSQGLARSILEVAAVIQPFTNGPEFKKAVSMLSDMQSDRSIDRCVSHLSEIGILREKDHQLYIKPDLMGDHILEELLSTSTGTNIVGEILSCSPNVYFENILQNLCQLDWCATQKNLAYDQLNALWGQLRRELSATTDVQRRYGIVQLVGKVAYYQPERALELIDLAIDEVDSTAYTEWTSKGDLIKAILVALESLAYIGDYLPSAIDRFIKLADIYPTMKRDYHADGPIGKLRAIITPSAHKPNWYMKTAVDYMAERLFEGEHSFSPFDVLNAALQANISDTVPVDNVSFEMRMYSLGPEQTKHYRHQVIEKILNCLPSGNISLATRAAQSLKSVFCVDNTKDWGGEFERILGKLKKIIQGQKIAPEVLAEVFVSVNWLSAKNAQFDTTVANLAKEITQEVIPQTLDFKISLAMIDCDGYGMFAHETYDFRTCQRKYREWMHDLAMQVVDEYREAYGIALDRIGGIMNILKQATKHDGHYIADRSVLTACCEESKEFCEALGEYVLAGRLDSGFAHCYIFSMYKTFNDVAAVKEFIEKSLRADNDELVAATIGELSLFYEMTTEVELSEIYEECVNDRPILARVVLRSLEWLPPEYKNLISSVINDVLPIAVELGVVDDLVRVISDIEQVKKIDIVRSIDHKKLLNCIKTLNSCDDYHCLSILQRVCSISPKEVLQLLFDRLEFSSNTLNKRERFEYYAVPFMTHLEMPPMASCEEILAILREEIGNQKIPHIDFYAGHIVRFFNISQGLLLKVSKDYLNESTKEGVVIAVILIRSMPADIIRQYNQVESLLKAASRCSDTAVNLVSDSIFSTIFNAPYMSSRTIGQPGDTETELNKLSEDVLQRAPIGSSVRRLYQRIHNYAVNELNRQEQRDKELLEM